MIQGSRSGAPLNKKEYLSQQNLNNNEMNEMDEINEINENNFKDSLCIGLSAMDTGISAAAFWYPPAWIPGIIGNIAHFGYCTVSNEESTTFDYALDGVGIVTNAISPMAPFSKIIVDEVVNLGVSAAKLGKHINDINDVNEKYDINENKNEL